MTMLTLKHLRYFEALARHGHFGRASEDCAISQPALSVQIKELEGILGAPLVERGPRHVRLTGLGETFADRARDILRRVDELGDLARATGDLMTGQFRLGIIPTIAPYLLPGVVHCLQDNFPGLDLRPREAVTQRLLGLLHDGQMDAAIMALPVPDPAFETVALFDEEFVLVRPQDDADKPVPGADGLRLMRLLLLEEGHCFRDQAIAFCTLSPSASRDLMEGNTLATLVQMVGAGIGVTLIPEMAIAVETGSAPVAVARLPAPRPTRSIGMVWRKTNPLAHHFDEIACLLRNRGMAALSRAHPKTVG